MARMRVSFFRICTNKNSKEVFHDYMLKVPDDYEVEDLNTLCMECSLTKDVEEYIDHFQNNGIDVIAHMEWDFDDIEQYGSMLENKDDDWQH